jgi:hypothetical protein
MKPQSYANSMNTEVFERRGRKGFAENAKEFKR